MSNEINTAFLRIARRAETNERAKLVETFVDVGPLFTLLGSSDHQVLYGRRGTGKTHALLYLAETRSAAGDAVVYLDMRTIGSTGGIYSDPAIPLTERATRLLVDTLTAIHSGLLDYSVNNADRINLSAVGSRLDRLADAITEVVVVGDVDRERSEGIRQEHQHLGSAHLSVNGGALGASLASESRETLSVQGERRFREAGVLRHRVHFGSVGALLGELIRELSPYKIWILLDEWSVIPLDLQPILADLLRRSIFPITGVSVKIGAIEQRSHFQIAGGMGEYLGLELGADIAADFDLPPSRVPPAMRVLVI